MREFNLNRLNMIQKTTLLVMLLVSFYSGAQIENDDSYNFNRLEQFIYSKEPDKEQAKTYLNELKAKATDGNSDALYYLALLHKEGIGVKKNSKKSLSIFKEAYELGDQKSAYIIGYFFLKGIGNTKQNYKKAYEWFQKSDSQMGQHWIAKMHFFGYGRPVDKQKAIEILKNNNIPNSATLVSQFELNQTNVELESSFNSLFNEYSLNQLKSFQNLNSKPNTSLLEGEWEGEYIELDWSSKKMERILPIKIDFNRTEGINNQLLIKIVISDTLVEAYGNYNTGKLDLSDLHLPIKKQYTDYAPFTHLINDVSNFKIRNIGVGDDRVLLFKPKLYIPLWDEKGKPSLIILKPKKENDRLNATAAFEEQADEFLRVYPNGFNDYFLLNFDMPKRGNVKIEARNHYGTSPYHQVYFKGVKSKGNHTIEINSPPTNRGSYILSIKVGNTTRTKIIIKN